MEVSGKYSNRILRKEWFMRKSTLSIALLFLAVGTVARAVEVSGSFADARGVAATANKPLLVEFYTEW